MQITTRGIRRRIAVIGAKDKGVAGLSTTETALATVLRATGEGHFRVQIVDADTAMALGLSVWASAVTPANCSLGRIPMRGLSRLICSSWTPPPKSFTLRSETRR